MYVLDEIDMGGPKLMYKHIWVGKVLENILKDHPRVLEEGPKLVPKTAQDSPTNRWRSTPSGSVDAPLVRSHQLGISGGIGEIK